MTDIGATRADLAKAWDEGALFAAVECGAIEDESKPWLARGDNPYRGNQDGAP